MIFYEFRKLLQKHFEHMTSDTAHLFTTNTDPDTLWDTYLDSFPRGTNEIYRERRHYDCACCRAFLRQFGNVVAIKDNEIVSIWDFDAQSDTFQPVVDALSALVKANSVKDYFATKRSTFGTDENHEAAEDGDVRTWHHFHLNLPSTSSPGRPSQRPPSQAPCVTRAPSCKDPSWKSRAKP